MDLVSRNCTKSSIARETPPCKFGTVKADTSWCNFMHFCRLFRYYNRHNLYFLVLFLRTKKFSYFLRLWALYIDICESDLAGNGQCPADGGVCLSVITSSRVTHSQSSFHLHISTVRYTQYCSAPNTIREVRKESRRSREDFLRWN